MANKGVEEERQRVQQGLSRREEIIRQGKAKRDDDNAEIARLQAQLAEDSSGWEDLQAKHTAYVAQEGERHQSDTKALGQARDAAAAGDAGDAAPGGASDAAPAEDGEAGEPAPAAAEACEPRACKGEAGEEVEVQLKDSEEWKKASIEAVEDGALFTVNFTESEQEVKVPLQRIRLPMSECGETPGDMDPHATASCESKQCGAVCTATCSAGYEGSARSYRCGEDGNWAPVVAEDAATCQLLPPAVPYVEKVTAEDSSLTVSFSVQEANGASYSISATPAAAGGAATQQTQLESATGTVAEATVDGLTNGVEYTITVEATNAAGSESSAGAR